MKNILENLLRSSNKKSSHKKRLFESGNMKLVVLYIIKKKSCYPYEIIKEISELTGGGYIPSTGAIYPALSYLLEHQLVSLQQLEGKRKQYSITENGAQYLNKKKNITDTIFSDLETRRNILNNEQYLDISRAIENLKMSLRLKTKSAPINEETVRQIANIIDKAAVEIGYIKNGEK